MKTNRSLLLSVLLAVVAVGAIGCGSDDSAKADRQAFYRVKGTRICVADQGRSLGLTLRYEDSTDSNGNGPFPLSGNWCGSNPLVIAANVTDPDGTNVFRVAAGNPEIGAPFVQVRCRYGSPSATSERQSFSETETKTFSCDPYTIEAIRETDSSDQKRFQIWVTRG